MCPWYVLISNKSFHRKRLSNILLPDIYGIKKNSKDLLRTELAFGSHLPYNSQKSRHLPSSSLPTPSSLSVICTLGVKMKRNH